VNRARLAVLRSLPKNDKPPLASLTSPRLTWDSGEAHLLEEPSIMFRSLLLVTLLLGPPTCLQAAPAPEAKPTKGDQLLTNLRKPGKFIGYDADPKFTLQEALEHLADRYNLDFDVNEEAFKAENVNDVLAQAVVNKPLAAVTRTTPAAVLKRLLARVPSESGVTWLLRADTIEITTQAAARLEIWGAEYEGPYLPLAHASFEQTSLRQALEDLAEQTGFSVVLDPRVGDKAKTLVTTRMINLPLDTAVETLADMAGLRSVRRDNLLYVTADGGSLKMRMGSNDETPTLIPRPQGVSIYGTKNLTFEKKPLHEAIKEVIEGSGYQVLIDTTRLGDKSKTLVSAVLKDVPVETAVRLLADLAGLRVVILDNVAYLTTPENAKELQMEQQRLLERLFNPSGVLRP
jgi:hypothetical protein